MSPEVAFKKRSRSPAPDNDDDTDPDPSISEPVSRTTSAKRRRTSKHQLSVVASGKHPRSPSPANDDDRDSDYHPSTSEPKLTPPTKHRRIDNPSSSVVAPRKRSRSPSPDNDDDRDSDYNPSTSEPRSTLPTKRRRISSPALSEPVRTLDGNSDGGKASSSSSSRSTKHARTQTSQKQRPVASSRAQKKKAPTPRSCPETELGCTETTTRKDDMWRHLLKHTNITFPCPVCLNAISRPDALRRHLKKKHPKLTPAEIEKIVADANAEKDRVLSEKYGWTEMDGFYLISAPTQSPRTLVSDTLIV